MDREKIIALIRKVRRLAESGVAGERSSAEARIKVLCEKYNITEADFSETETLENRYFLYKDPIEREILSNVICMVLKVPVFKCGENNNVLKIKLVKIQYEHIDSAYEYYKDMFNFYARHLVRGILSRNMVGFIPPSPTEPVTPAEPIPDTKAENKKPEISDIDPLVVMKLAVAIEKLPWESPHDKNLQVSDKSSIVAGEDASSTGKNTDITGSCIKPDC